MSFRAKTNLVFNIFFLKKWYAHPKYSPCRPPPAPPHDEDGHDDDQDEGDDGAHHYGQDVGVATRSGPPLSVPVEPLLVPRAEGGGRLGPTVGTGVPGR